MFSSNQNTSNTGFGFGASPNQGTGTFGSGTAGTGGTGAFGTTNNTTGGISMTRPQNTDSSAFGGGSTAFGQRPTGT